MQAVDRPVIAQIRTRLQIAVTALRNLYLRRVWGMKIDRGARISGKAFLDYTNPGGIHIGAYTIVTPGARIFTHDFVKARHLDTRIGSRCFVGANAIILAGVTIGNGCVIGAGAVVTGDVPDNSMVAGNPARIVRSDIETGYWGMMAEGAPGLHAADPTTYRPQASR